MGTNRGEKLVKQVLLEGGEIRNSLLVLRSLRWVLAIPGEEPSGQAG